MISTTDLIALLPLIVLSGTAVLAMLAISFHRNHQLVFVLTVAGILAALVAVFPAAGLVPRPVTPLLLVDRYALAFTVLAGAAGLAVVCLCRDYFAGRVDQPEELYLLILTALLGAGVLAAARHFATFFLGLETLSVSLFALIAYPYRDERALEAGMKYLVLSGAASGFLVFGMALVYADTGVLDFAGLATASGTLVDIIGMILIVVAVGFKLSLVPFHLWTADVYQGAPAPVTSLLATVSKGAVFVLLLRYTVAGGLVRAPVLSEVLSLIAIASMLVGNLLALQQGNVKRILAYSSIAHMGYLLIVLVAGARIGGAFAAEALLFYLAAYFATTLAAFGVVTVLSPADREAESLEDYDGLFRTRPWPAAVFTVALLSLAGIPLTAGFVGKFYLFAAGGQGELWVLIGALIVGSGLGLYYYLRVISHMVRDSEATAVAEGTAGAVPLVANLVLGVLLIVVVGLGVWPAGLIDVLLPAAGGLR
jgi:NADH-quinone oxidoreductase subunit N